MPETPDATATPPPLEGLADLMTIPEAAKAARVSPSTIRRAIKAGELDAILIGGREPLRAGRGLGYRITREDLTAWFFGLPREAPRVVG